MKEIKNILIFNPFGIGDVLFTTPLIRNLKENFKNASLVYLCNRRTYPLLKNNIFLDKVWVFEKDEWRELARKSKRLLFKALINFLKKIKKEKFDILFDFSLNAQYGFFLKLAKIKMRIGFDFKKRGRFLTHRIKLPSGYKDKHVASYYTESLKFLGICPKSYKFDLFFPKNYSEEERKLLSIFSLKKDDFLVGVCPGSGDSWQDTAYFKRWPKEKFLKLCQELQRKMELKIILFGSKQEKELCDYIFENLKEKPLNLCGKIDLEEFCVLLSLCKLIITNDGGPFHLAQALNKKVIVFFGPVDEKVYGAYPEENRNCIIFKKDIFCRPCYKELKFRGCSFDKKCLREIKVEDVLSKIEKLLSF